MRLSRAVLLCWVVLIIFIYTALCGCSAPDNSDSPGSAVEKGVRTEVDAGVQVIDPASGQPVANVPVYFAAYVSGGKNTGDLYTSNATGNDGWARFTVIRYMDEGNTIYLGASTDKALIESDLASNNFTGNGNAGAWSSFNYEFIKPDKASDGAFIEISLSVDGVTRKMMD